MGANSFSEAGGLGGLGGQGAPEGELPGGLGGLGGGMASQMAGGLGAEEARSAVPRSFIPRSFRKAKTGYLTRKPLDEGLNAAIVKKTEIPQPQQ